MVQLQKNRKTLEDNGIQIAAISYDPVNVLEAFAKRQNITYPLLSDPGSKTIAAFGILNAEATRPPFKGIPYPGTFLIDPSGTVRAKLFVDGYRDRHSLEDLLKAANGF